MYANKRLLMLAAILASSSAVELDATGQDSLQIRADFEERASNELVTGDAYRVQINRVALPSGDIDLHPRHADDLDRILAQLERPTVDITPGLGFEPVETELVLENARFEGRVFDDVGGRLPIEGIGIHGEVPLNMRLVRTGDDRRPLDVLFEVPVRFFDGVDWGRPA